jgi:hypothetical protein
VSAFLAVGPSAADGRFHPSLHFIESCPFTFSTAALSGTSFVDKSIPFMVSSPFILFSSLFRTDPNRQSTAFSLTTAFLPRSSLFATSSADQSIPFFITSAFVDGQSRSVDGSFDSRSGLSVGLIVGMTIVVVGVIVICVAVAAVIHRRKHQLSDGSDGSDQSDRMMLHLDFTDNHLNSTIDTTETTFFDTTTSEDAPEGPSSIRDRFAVDLNSPLSP